MAEVILSVAAYWWIAVHFNTHVHLWVSVFAAPLVLLRSDASVEKARGMWERYKKEDADFSKFRGAVTAIISALLSGFLCCLIVDVWSIKFDEGEFIKRSSLLGFILVNTAVAVSIVGALTDKAIIKTVIVSIMVAIITIILPSIEIFFSLILVILMAFMSIFIKELLVSIAMLLISIVWLFQFLISEQFLTSFAVILPLVAGAMLAISVPLLLLFGFTLGYWVRTFFIRIIAVTSHLIQGLRSARKNWRLVMLHEDFAHAPEMVPGLPETDFWNIFKEWSDDRPVFRWSIRIISVPIWFLPALIWRYSLKSTIWFYLPFILIARPGALKGDAARKARVDGPTPWNERFGVIFALSALAFAVIAYTDWGAAWTWFESLRGEAPMSPVAFLFVTDWAKLVDQPWKWFSLPAAALTIILWLWINRLHSLRVGARRNDQDADAQYAPSAALYWLDRFRNALVIVSIILGFGYFTVISYHECLLQPLAPLLRTILGAAVCCCP